MAKRSLYPPNPEDVPEDFTDTSSAYVTHTLLVLSSLALFFLLYFGLMLFCVFFAIWAVFLCPYRGSPWGLIKVVSLVATPFALTLVLFMLKNLFKFEYARKDDSIEIFAEEHPRLFEFIDQICADVGAAAPKHVYVEYRVTAYVRPETSSFFHLFLPTERTLVIGLGLVNAINLTEFKALLAHEFGHFSQKTTKLDVYVSKALQISYHMIDGEDALDRFVARWQSVPSIVALPAYVIAGLLWCVRKLLGGMRAVVYLFHLAHSRQLEYNADLVAVSLAGSDAITHLLHRTFLGQASLSQGLNDLSVALDSHLYTSDLFYHQSAAVKVVRKKTTDPRLLEPPSLPADRRKKTQVFEEDDDKSAEMWAGHPSDFDREQNAKAHYIRSQFDERSPWLLFSDVAQLRERVSFKVYRFFFKVPKNVVLADPEEVQGFIDDEHADRTYDPKYQGLYDSRNLVLKDPTGLANEGARQPWSIAELSHAHATLYNAEVKHRAQLYYKRLEEVNLLNAILNGWHRPKHDELEFRGEIHEPKAAKRLLTKVEKELERDNPWLEEQDRRVFMTYFQMALHIKQEVAEELYRRYDFHLALQDIWFDLQKQDRSVQAAIVFLNAQTSNVMQENHFQELLQIFRDAHKKMRRLLERAEDLTLPALTNLPAGKPLRPFLLEKRLIDGLSQYEHRISERWIVRMLDQFNEMKAKVDRIHFKSLAGILALQERVGAECLNRWSSLPAVTAVRTD